MLDNIEFYDVEQNTDEWYELRKGHATGSSAAKIMAHYPKGFGDPARKYAQKKALEIVTCKLDQTDSFKNDWMDRGHELEPVARELYEIETFSEVKNGGFFSAGRVGDSPDGVVGSDGRVEIKCVGQNAHWPLLKKGGYPSEHKWQLQWHLIFGARWCDFVSYCPEFPENKRLYICTVYRDDEMQIQLKHRISQFNDLVDENIRLLK